MKDYASMTEQELAEVKGRFRVAEVEFENLLLAIGAATASAYSSSREMLVWEHTETGWQPCWEVDGRRISEPDIVTIHLTLTFSHEIQEMEEVLYQVQQALVHWVESGPGFVPEEAVGYTQLIHLHEVSTGWESSYDFEAIYKELEANHDE